MTLAHYACDTQYEIVHSRQVLHAIPGLTVSVCILNLVCFCLFIDIQRSLFVGKVTCQVHRLLQYTIPSYECTSLCFANDKNKT